MNPITVTVGQLPVVPFKPVKVSAPFNVAATLQAAGITFAAGWEIRVNSVPATLESIVAEGNIVVLVQAVKGN